MKHLYLLLANCLISTVAAAGYQRDYVLSAGAPPEKFALPVTMSAPEQREIEIDVRQVKNSGGHFFYIQFTLQCGDTVEIARSFSLFPLNRGGTFTFSIASDTGEKLDAETLRGCDASLSLHGRDGGAVAESVEVEGIISYR